MQDQKVIQTDRKGRKMNDESDENPEEGKDEHIRKTGLVQNKKQNEVFSGKTNK